MKGGQFRVVIHFIHQGGVRPSRDMKIHPAQADGVKPRLDMPAPHIVFPEGLVVFLGRKDPALRTGIPRDIFPCADIFDESLRKRRLAMGVVRLRAVDLTAIRAAA